MTGRAPPVGGTLGDSIQDRAVGLDAAAIPGAGGEPARPLVSVADAEQLAQVRLPAPVWDFIAGGSGAELTRRANLAAIDDVGLVPRVLAGVRECDQRATLAGCPAALPVAVA